MLYCLIYQLYGCGTWSLVLREEHRFRTLRRIFGPKREEVAGGWRTLHNEVLHNLYISQNIIRMIKLGGNEIGRAHSMHGRDEKFVQNLCWETSREETTWEELCIDGKRL
jgi:hypothetical protein